MGATVKVRLQSVHWEGAGIVVQTSDSFAVQVCVCVCVSLTDPA